jgi:hypothetical protein
MKKLQLSCARYRTPPHTAGATHSAGGALLRSPLWA